MDRLKKAPPRAQALGGAVSSAVVRLTERRRAGGSGFRASRVPARPRGILHIEFWDVGLEVEKGSTVEHVHPLDIQGGAHPAEQPHDRQADWVGTGWMAGRKEPTLGVVEERAHVQAVPSGLVKYIHQDDC